jgi:hypothetical protein
MAKTDESDRNKHGLIYYQVDSERITAESEWRNGLWKRKDCILS